MEGDGNADKLHYHYSIGIPVLPAKGDPKIGKLESPIGMIADRCSN